MHKLVILLVESNSRKDAIEKTENFLNNYGDNKVFDYYRIGGQWESILAPEDLFNSYIELSGKYISNKKDITKLQEIWETLGLKGQCPHHYHYTSSINPNLYNAVPLNECLPTVKSFLKDIELEKEKLWEQIIKEKEMEDSGEKSFWLAYNMRQYSQLDYRDEFNIEKNVFNITDYESEVIPEKIENYWAIVIDMHY